MVANEKWFGASAGFYPETIDQSLRFNEDDNAYLKKTYSGAGNTKTWTWSGWIKRANLNFRQQIFGQLDVSVTNRQNYAYFHEDGHIWFVNYTTSGYNYRLTTNQVFLDPTNWYHLVFVQDTTQSTSSDRLKIYVNGTQITSFSTATYPSLNFDGWINQNTGQGIQFGVGKVVPYSSNDQPLDGYMAEVNFIDGTALTPSSFGETKNGVWIPKEISGLTYGTNGFRLTFADSSSLGDDTSGNGNDYTTNGFASTDVVLDSPTNNFCTINSVRESTVYNGSVTFSEGSLQSVDAGTTYSLHWTSTFEMTTGKWYWEILAHTMGGSSANIGICNEAHKVAAYGTGVFYGNDGKRNAVTFFTGTTSYGDSYTNGDIIGVAFDADNETVTFYKNNSSQGAVGSVLTTANGGYFAAVGDGQNATTYKYVANFGQDSSFAGNKTAQGNTDANGVGDFYYSPPSGYLALCSSNLNDTTISPNQNEQADDHFNTVLYSGNGSNSHQITGVGFQPDWVWLKPRSDADNHVLFDSSRGALKSLHSNLTNSESTDSNALISFDSDGFTLNDWNNINENSQTYVSWNWRCGGTAPTKTYKVKVVADSTDYGHGTGSNKYQFFKSDGTTGFGTNGVDLDLQEGGTYVFDWSDTTAQGHPLRFSLTNDGTHSNGTSAGSEYTTGVVKDDSAYKTTITVASGVASLYYYCANHSGMGAEVRTNTTFGSTNFDGEVLSVTQNNSDAGFSIATFTGSSASNSTFSVGHGLGSTPKMIIAKQRNLASGWSIYHHKIDSSAPQGYYILLNDTGARVSSSTAWGNTAPTSTVFSTYTSGFWGTSAEIVAYSFDEVEGYSKFGSYTGTGSTDGAFVFTGFRPAFVMIKRTNGTGEWFIMDNKRIGYNGANYRLLANQNLVEYTGSNSNIINILSNGFKCKVVSDNHNGSGLPYIYMAFSEMPFKFSNAR